MKLLTALSLILVLLCANEKASAENIIQFGTNTTLNASTQFQQWASWQFAYKDEIVTGSLYLISAFDQYRMGNYEAGDNWRDLALYLIVDGLNLDYGIAFATTFPQPYIIDPLSGYAVYYVENFWSTAIVGGVVINLYDYSLRNASEQGAIIIPRSRTTLIYTEVPIPGLRPLPIFVPNYPGGLWIDIRSGLIGTGQILREISADLIAGAIGGPAPDEASGLSILEVPFGIVAGALPSPVPGPFGVP
jgi:hypothetical protein